MDGSLRNAAQQGNIDALYSLIERDAYVLDRIDVIPFVETPLHIAASAGHTEFAGEIMRLKPSFAKKLNQNGFTPVHLALQNNQTQLVLHLLEVEEDLVRVPGKEGVTPLHYIAQIGNLDLLAKFLRICPKSIEDVTIRGETVLHIALKYNKVDAFQLVLGWLRRAWFKNASLWEKKLLDGQDVEGNTVLHIAVTKNQPEFVRLILKPRRFFWWCTVDIKAKNSRGDTAFDILQGDNQQIKGMLRRTRYLTTFHFPRVASHAKYFRSAVGIDEELYIIFLRLTTKISNDMRNVLLVVATLLVAVSFQAAISPPGGLWQDIQLPDFNRTDQSAPDIGPAHNIGTSTLSETTFYILSSLNGLSFFVTVFSIFLLLPSGFGTGMLCLPLYTLSMSFIFSIAITDPQVEGPSALEKRWWTSVLFCVLSPMVFLFFVVFVSFRRNKLVEAFRPKVKVLDPTLKF